MNCFLEDGSVEDYVKATLDPIPTLSTLKVSRTDTVKVNTELSDIKYIDRMTTISSSFV